ncbi:MAG: FAD-dependent oxidoreductase [Thermoplasmatota archaeon]
MKKKVKRLLLKMGVYQGSCRIENGIVTLNGSVNTYDEFLKIGKYIGKQKGIEGVVNNLEYPKKRERKKISGNYDVIGKADMVIIGAGVIGCMIARELSKYDLSVILVEKKEDVAMGTTKANNAMVHTGIGEKMGSLKQRFCIEGHALFPDLSEQLQVPFRYTGMWIVITTETLSGLRIPQFFRNLISKWLLPTLICRRGKKLGIPMSKVSRKDFLEKEENATKKTIAAVYSPTYAVTCPYRLTIALAENAVENGVELLLDTEVVDIEKNQNRINAVVTTKGVIQTSLVINAAGVFVDDIARMADAQEFTIHPKKGASILFDNEMEGFVHHCMSHLDIPKKPNYKGGAVMYTVDGNIQWGPTIKEVDDKKDVTVTKDELTEIITRYKRLIPDFPMSKIIAYFSGLRASSFTEDFIIRQAREVEGLIHVAGIQSPGLTAAPAIALQVIDIVKKMGLRLDRKKDFISQRRKPVVFRDLSLSEQKKLVAEQPLYGTVVCRCETVTEAEIVDVIQSVIPAKTVDAVKRRTRAGMGRCQGGFCLSKVAEIIAREQNIPVESVTKKGKDSKLFIGKAKCLLTSDSDYS